MKRGIKQTFSATFILLLSAGLLSTISAQQSDYEIQQDFRSDFNELITWVDNAVSSEDLEDISERISEFEEEYSGHTDLINSAIFPDTFGSRMADLRARYVAAEQNIVTIEQLNERVEEMAEELDEFRAQLSEMNEQAQQLLADIQASEANEQQLSVLVQQYRQRVQERDRFVSQFLQTLLDRYETMDPAAAQELTDAADQLDENPLDLVRTILAEYINFTDQASGLEAPDYLRMKTQQVYFRQIWETIGENVSEVFASDRPVQAEQEVTDLLNQWNSSIENRLWNTLTTAFSQNNISLGDFNSATAFYNSLNAYVNDATSASREVNSEEDYERFRNFSRFWNTTVKGQWGEYLLNSNVLTYQQLGEIDQQLDDWNQAAIPTSNLMLILFLVSIAVIIGLVVMLVSKK